MKKLVVFIFLCSSALFWFFYPTNIPTTSYSVDRLPKDRYIEIKSLLLRYAKKNSSLGVEVKGDDEAAGTLAINCRNVPMVFVFDFPGATSLMVSEGAFARSPGLEKEVMTVLSIMKAGGQVDVKLGAGNVTKLDAFFLRHRDGIDINSVCTG